jgi:nickel/cobalt exporter
MKAPVLLSGFLVAVVLEAHPMGNFSVNHYAKISIGAREVTVRYALDLAEIPSFELLQKWNLDATAAREELERKAEAQAREWAGKLDFRVEGRTVAPRFERSALVIDKGAGGMPVLRVTAELMLPVATGRLEYEDHNYAERAGWKEIVIAAAPGASIDQATQDDRDRSQALTAYPQDPTVAPPQDLRAAVTWTAASVVSKVAPPRLVPLPQPAPPKQENPTATAPLPPQASAPGTVVRGDFLSQLLHRGDIGVGLMLAGLAVAFGLGAVHALSPGHGKTIVAAYLVGTRGTARHAIFLGGLVTFTHTISVFFLGLTTLFLSQYVLTEQIFPILGAISGGSIVWIGAMLLYKRVQVLRGHHSHHHHHGPGGHSHVPEGEVTLASLIALGVSGGLVPCPSALVLLLSSIALGRVALGLLLLVAFSAGLAVVLMAIGIIVLYAKHLLPDSRKTANHAAFRVIPVVSAAIIVCLGLIMTGVSLGVIRPSRFIG